MTVEGLTELIVKDSYISREIQTFLKEAGKQNLKEMTVRCQNYREAHNIHGDDRRICAYCTYLAKLGWGHVRLHPPFSVVDEHFVLLKRLITYCINHCIQ